MTVVDRRPIDLDALADLEEQRRFLLGSLRDLERERDAGDIDDGDYQTLRDDYTARTAAVLRAIEDGRATLTAPREPRRTRARRIRITALATVGVLGLAIVAGLLVARSSGERVQGGTPAGNATSPTAARLREAHDLDQKGRALDAIKAYDAVLRLDPKNVDALTAEGWLIGRTGLQAGSVELVDKGLASIDKALAVDASYPSAHAFKGLLLYRGKNDPAAAIPELQAFLAGNPTPDDRAQVENVLAQAMKDAGR